MQIKKLEADDIADFVALIKIFANVFENAAAIPDNLYLHKLLSNPDFLVFVAKTNGQVVGGLTIYVLHQYNSQKPVAYIYDVGISPDFQRQGHGRALISEACRYCGAKRFDCAYVEAEDEDTSAVSFYRQTPFSAETLARHFTYTF